MHKKWLCSVVMAGAILFATHGAFAQLIERPIPFPTGGSPASASARVLAEGDTISLPFWDDFSTTLERPSGKWWAYGEDVYVNQTLGLHPPSLGVATFDGLTRLGVPHNGTSNFVGPADSLVSRAIDLSAIPANIRSTVFLSFYWQIKGLGELPNEEDSLRLQFFDREGNWVTQWVLNGGEANLSDEFQTAFIPVTQPEYYHAGFRFRFQGFNKQTGPFDHWHIDYVYMNLNRSTGDNAFFDRALTTPPLTPLMGLYAVPSDQLREAADALSGSATFEFYNLDVLLQPVEYNLRVSDPSTGGIITWIDQDRVVDPIPQGKERRTISSSSIDAAALAAALEGRDSAVLELEVFLKSGDKFLINRVDPLTADTTYFENIDFRNNDTTSVSLTIHNYTAYDDGSAEYAAGINQSRGQLAYKVAAIAGDTLTGIDIYFPRIAPFAEGQPIDVLVWKTLTNVNPTLLVSQRFSIKYSDSLNRFTRYRFETPVVVKDTFYIGYRQYTDNFVGIGLDKNTNSGDRIFYNVGNGWVQNDRTEGSPMLRPVFEKTDAMPITGVDRQPASQLLPYPNPSTGIIRFHHAPEELQVSDLSGKVVYRQNGKPTGHPFEADLSHLPKGLYFVQYVYGRQRFTFKLMLTD